MIRILLPLAVLALLQFAPLFADQVQGSDLGGGEVELTGNDYVGNSINCWIGQNFSITDDCAPKGGEKGLGIFAASIALAGAAVLGVLGLLPFLGRLVSFVTCIAGLVAIGAVGFFVMSQMGSPEGLDGIRWGAYGAGGGGLLTLISGLSGIRGDR